MFELASADIVYDFGSIPSWLVGIAALGMFLISWRASHNSAKAAKLAALAVAEIQAVHRETNGMREALEAAKLQEGRQQVMDEQAQAVAETHIREM